MYKVSIIPRGRPGRHHVPAGGGPLQPQPALYHQPDLQPVRRAHRRGNDARQGRGHHRASNDIQRATDIARKMVTQWGLSEKWGR